MAQHLVPKKIYFLVFATLMVLTMATIIVAEADLGPWNTLIAMAIAFTKALLVILFFMHVRYSTHLIKVVVLAGFFWLALRVGLLMTDFLTRGWIPSSPGW